MLATPLPMAEARQRLLAIAPYSQTDMATELEFAAATEEPTPHWSRHYQLCSLEMKLAQLATWQSTENARMQALQAAFAELERSMTQPADEPSQNAANTRWEALHKFSTRLRELYATLTREVQTAVGQDDVLVTRETAWQQAVRAKRAMQLLDARDAWRLRGVSFSTLLGSAARTR